LSFSIYFENPRELSSGSSSYGQDEMTFEISKSDCIKFLKENGRNDKKEIK
jgi:hypothetical protein